MDCFLFGQCCQTIEVDMSDYNWCHGPKCHERKTTTRVRGVKGSKVLRTIKINVNKNYRNRYWKVFCDQTCLLDFMWKHWNEFITLHPRPEALETPIDVVVETHTDWQGLPYKQKAIREVDNA